MNKIIIFCLFVLSGLLQAAPFVSKAAAPLNRDYIIEQLKPYWGNGPEEKDIVDTDVKMLSQTDMGDHVRWHISYMVENDDMSYAYILLPKPLPTAANPAAVVLCPHPTNGFGKDVVCGIHKDAAADEDEAGKRAQREYALELVRMGFICFAPDMAGYGQRVTIDLPTTRYNFEHVAAFKEKWLAKWPGGKFPHYKQLWDIQRSIDVIVKYDFVDKDNIGIIGHSLGAWTAITAAAYDTRIKASVANAGGGLHFMPQLWTDNEELKKYFADSSSQNLHSNMNAFIMLTAPRAFLTIKPYNDYVEYERAWPNHFEAFRIIADYYRQAAGADKDYKAPFDIYFHNRTHTFEQDSRALAYGWLDKQLRSNTSYLNKVDTKQNINAPKGNSYEVESLYDIKVSHDVEYAPGKKLDVYMPVSDDTGRKFAAIVMIHGGGWVAGEKRQAREVRTASVLASRGYVCVDIDYTLAKKDSPSWPQCLYDCKNAVKFLRKNADKYNVDAERIAVMGGSAGGHLALMTAFTGDEKYKTGIYDEFSDKVCAVVDLYGVTNVLSWRYTGGDGTLKTNGDLLLGYSVQDKPQLWIDASPALIVKDDAPPTLMLHGTADKIVNIEQSIELEQILQQKNIRHKLITVEGAEHSFTFDSTTTNLWPDVLAFLDENLNKSGK